jgi:hypothetical protein
MIDFSGVDNKTQKVYDIAPNYTVDDLRRASNESIDFMLDILRDLTDADVTFDPVDPLADDPYAKEGEEKIGWNLAHLVVHVTATSEEWAAYSPILARGIAYPSEPRLRYETEWQTVTTHSQCVQRLEESRRMRLAALDMWPDTPNLDVKRELSPRFAEYAGPINAPAAFLFGLYHEHQHRGQFEDVRQQALAARAIANS